MRRMIADCLFESGWDIVGEACNGADAVEKYTELYEKGEAPDAVTMDIVMPGTDGLYALSRILEIDINAKIVVVSGLNQTKKISDAIRLGAHDFIAKPFMPDQLSKTIDDCITAGEIDLSQAN